MTLFGNRVFADVDQRSPGLGAPQSKAWRPPKKSSKDIETHGGGHAERPQAMERRGLPATPEAERPGTDPALGGEPADMVTADAGLQTERRLAVTLNHPVPRALPWRPQDVVAEPPASHQPAPQSRAPHPTLARTHSPFQGPPPEAATSPTRALGDRCPSRSLSLRCFGL